MKSLKIILLLAPLPLLGACDSFNFDECASRYVRVIAITGGENSPTILKVAPDTIKIKEGGCFEVRFAGGKTVSTVGETQNWLNKGKHSSSPITITVPSGKARPDPYKYTIVVDKFGTLDPRVRVTD